jgi:hypothetical protein
MKKHFIINSLGTDIYYSYNKYFDVLSMALKFYTKEEAITYAINHNLGSFKIQEFYCQCFPPKCRVCGKPASNFEKYQFCSVGCGTNFWADVSGY